MTRMFKTGRTRFRAKVEGESVLLVLQVEESYGGSPLTRWRDARVEDLRGKELVVNT